MSAGVGRTVSEAELRLTASQQTDAAFQAVARNVDRLTGKVGAYAQQQNTFFTRMAGGAAGLERRLTAATAAMTGGELLRRSIMDFAAMDRRMTRLGQNAGEGSKEIQRMKKELIDLADKTGQPIDEIISGFETFVRQTGDYASAKKQIEAIAIANAGLGASMQDTAQTARVLQNVLKIDPSDTMKAFDMIAEAGNRGAFEAKHIADYLPMLGESMARAGLTGAKGLAEALAMLETIQETVKEPEQTALAFRDMFNKIVTPETDNHFKRQLGDSFSLQPYISKALREGKSLGATIVQITDEALKIIADKNNAPQDQRNTFIAQLFPEIDSQRAINSLLTRYSKVGPLMMDILHKSAGASVRQARQVMNDTQSDLTRLANKYEEVKDALGKALVDAGALAGMDEFKARVKDIGDALGTVGSMLERIRNNPLSLPKEIGKGAFDLLIGDKKAEEMVTRFRDNNAREAKEHYDRSVGSYGRGDVQMGAYQKKLGDDLLAQSKRWDDVLKGKGTFGTALFGIDSSTVKDVQDGIGGVVDALKEAPRRIGEGVAGSPGAPREVPVPALPPAGEDGYRRMQMKPEFQLQNGSGDLRGLIHKGSFETSPTAERRTATERGQTDSLRVAERQLDELKRLVQHVALHKGGEGEGDGLGGSGSGAGGGSGGGGGGGGGAGGSGGSSSSADQPGGAGGGGGRNAFGGTDPMGANGAAGSNVGGEAPRGDGTGNKGSPGRQAMMRYAMDQLRREGVPESQLRRAAAHLVGQAQAESGLDPNKVHDGGTGYGIYGARDPSPGRGRRTEMLKWMKANGYAPNSAEGQMRYMAKEAMSGAYPKTRDVLMGKGTGNVDQDTNTITREFERPKIINRRSGGVEQAFRDGPGEELAGGGQAAGDQAARDGAGGVDQRQSGTRRQPITDTLRDQLAYAGAQSGVNAEVYSGGQDSHGRNRTGSHRHDHGRSADVRLYVPDGKGGKRYLSMNNEADRAVMESFIKNSVRAGATGVGAGPGYMGDKGIHIGGGSSLAWGAGGRAANAPDWVRRAHREGTAERQRAPVNMEAWKKGRSNTDEMAAREQRLKQHREEMEKPIKVRYQTDGVGTFSGHRGSIQARREQEQHMREARYNTFSDQGVA